MESFDLQFDETESVVVSRRSLQPPPDYSSRTMRRRLLLLVGSFFLVLFLMREARKPERWYWMGFDSQGRQAGASSNLPDRSDTVGASLDSAGITVRIGEADAPRQDRQTVDPPAKSEVKNVAGDQLSENTAPKHLGSTTSLRTASQFWSAVFLELNHRDQQQLLTLFHELASGKAYDDSTAARRSDLLDRLDSITKSKSLKELDTLKGSQSSAAEVLVQEVQKWDDNVLPFLRGSISKDLSNIDMERAPLGIWQSHMETAALGRVRDKSEVHRPEEGAAWIANWMRTLDSSPSQHKSVSAFDLTTQPSAFRGMPVEVAGTVVGIERYFMVKNELGVDGYYILWIVEPTLDLPMLCAYTLTLPKGIETPQENFVRANFDVKVKGVFHKLRSYVGSTEQIETCPLIFSKQASVVFRPAVESTEGVPLWFLISLGVILFSSAVAALISVYRSTRHRTYPIRSPVYQQPLASDFSELNNREPNQSVSPKDSVTIDQRD